jgi:hypothetical protein
MLSVSSGIASESEPLTSQITTDHSRNHAVLPDYHPLITSSPLHTLTHAGRGRIETWLLVTIYRKPILEVDNGGLDLVSYKGSGVRDSLSWGCVSEGLDDEGDTYL